MTNTLRHRRTLISPLSLAAIAAAAGMLVAIAAPAASAQPVRPRGAPAIAPAVAPAADHATASAERAPELLAILDEHVEFLKRSSPLTASTRGDFRFNDQLSDESPEAYAARRVEVADRLDRLRALPRNGWTEDDHLDADLLDYVLSRQLASARFHPEQKPVNTLSGPQVWLPQMWMTLPFQSPQHYVDYATRLERVPTLIEQNITQMRRGLEAGRVPPRVVMQAAVEQCRIQAMPEIERDPTLSPFYRPFAALPDDEAAARARRAIAEGIVPAFRSLADFLDREYIPRTRESIAIKDGVDGIAAYDHALSVHTTLPLTAEQVHQIGLSEVSRIRAEMLVTIARSDFLQNRSDDGPTPTGDDLIAAFLQYLRTDTRFYYDSAADLLAGYREIAKRIDPEMPGLFGTLPRNTYGVREIPRFAAVSSPTAYYYPGSVRAGLPGWFMANTHRLDQRPKYSMIALTLHEAVPGHHLQIALAQELENQHEYRQWLGFTAFGEGWALYAERLGLEMGTPPFGLYADPYDDFGRLSFEMWRACRLVVDTGMHAKGWSRDQAIDFMLANTALARFDIEREIDRYIGWPGQATAYKIGELKIREFRDRAESALGPRFNIREFHDCILLAGAIPLEVLEARVDRWIESVRAR
jgi:uncharacterized protein (DUF885 family)